MVDKNELIKNAQKALLDGISQIKKIREIAIDKKTGNDIVTNVDLLVEKTIIERVREIYPNHRILSEEIGLINEGLQSDYLWIIDPIDGTINFANDLPFYTTTIAVQYKNKTLVGFVYNHSTSDFYKAIKGGGAYKNNKRLKLNNSKALRDSIISFMLTSHYSQDKIEEVLSVVSRIAIKVRGLRLFVGQALELCVLAEGKLDGYFFQKSSGIGAAAEVLLVEEAGGFIASVDKNNFNNNSKSLVVAGNQRLLKDLLEIIQS